MRVRKALQSALATLLCRVFSGAVCTRLIQYFCNHSTSGHHYTVGIVAAEDERSYVIDPLTSCLRCDKPMSSHVYAELVAAYVRVSACVEDDA